MEYSITITQDMYYFYKYQKYRNKYLRLKLQIGGVGPESELLKQDTLLYPPEEEITIITTGLGAHDNNHETIIAVFANVLKELRKTFKRVKVIHYDSGNGDKHTVFKAKRFREIINRLRDMVDTTITMRKWFNFDRLNDLVGTPHLIIDFAHILHYSLNGYLAVSSETSEQDQSIRLSGRINAFFFIPYEELTDYAKHLLLTTPLIKVLSPEVIMTYGDVILLYGQSQHLAVDQCSQLLTEGFNLNQLWNRVSEVPVDALIQDITPDYINLPPE